LINVLSVGRVIRGRELNLTVEDADDAVAVLSAG
jgi:hypothetical protein